MFGKGHICARRARVYIITVDERARDDRISCTLNGAPFRDRANVPSDP